MVEFNGAGVVAVPVPSSVVEFVPFPVNPEMVLWALPGPTGDIPYADVEALVDAEFDDRIDTMTQLEASTQIAASTASTAAGAAADSASDAVGVRSDVRWVRDNDVYPARDAAVSAAGTATTQAGIATEAAGIAEQYALEFDLDVTSATGAAGSQASATVTGDGPAYQINIVIPQGAEGPKGDNGEITQAQLDAAVASLVDNAPEALDTLTELAAALGNDPNFATSTATEIGKRVLIDGAPAEYNTLGKLVTALQNHELGGSTDASVLEGALTDQVEASEAVIQYRPGGQSEVIASGLSEAVNDAAYMGQMAYNYMVYELFPSLEALGPILDGKADIGHTHDGADITGALTDAVDAGAATIEYYSIVTGLTTTLRVDKIGEAVTSEIADAFGAALEEKSDVGHTHDGGDITGDLTTSVDVTNATVQYGGATGGLGANLGLLFNLLDNKSDTSHTHTAAQVGAEPAAWSGTQAQFNALGTKNPNRTYYIID